MKKWMIWGFGMVIGAVGGYLYWYYVGCISGTCAITSSPVNSTLYGGLMGGLMVNLFDRKKNDKTPDENLPTEKG
jgi:Family of unknown function (DUF6132)